jgi:hypothetical protein
MVRVIPGAIPSGIVLPDEERLELRKIVEGLFVVQNAYTRDDGFFSRPTLYDRKPFVCEHEVEPSGPTTDAVR